MSICSTNSSVGRHKLDNLMSFMLHELVGISFALCFVSTTHSLCIRTVVASVNSKYFSLQTCSPMAKSKKCISPI